MKHSLPFLFFVLLCSLLGSQPARASHLLGGDMTYASLGNNQYRVKLRLYRDCSGITVSSFTLECRNGGCNSTATLTTPLVQQGPVEAGNPFCAAVSTGPCQGPTGLTNYDIYTFLATVTLPPGNWTMSTSQNGRSAMGNIVAGDLYVEATLDNRNSTTGAAVANSSPQFDPQNIPVQYACWKQRTTITYSLTEPDGDSLVYALAAPLQACGTPVTYNAMPTTGPVTGIITPNAQCPTCPLCVFQYTGASGNYSPTNPIQTAVDTIGACPLKTGVSSPFFFNAQARTISFTPGLYYPPTTPVGFPPNKYQLAILITEYRRINGVRRVIGTVRREATIIVTDCGGNSIPNPPIASNQTSSTGPSISQIDTTRLDVYSCSYSRVQLSFTDPDNLRTPSASQLLTVALPANINTDPNLLDSGDVGSFVLTGNSTTNPKGTFFFQPSPSTVGRIIRFIVRIEDNACPIKGVQNRVIVIMVRRGNFASVVATATGNVPAVCLGSSLSLTGNALRPDSVRQISNTTTIPQTYGYQWSLVSGNGLNTATTNQRTITVTPTITSRYRLQITPLSGYGPGCGDTTSVVVRVLPGVPVPIVTRNGNILTSSAATGNQWYRDGQAIAGATSQTLTTTTNGTYTVLVTSGTGTSSCTAASVPLMVLATQRALPGTSLNVLPNPTPDGRFNVVLTGYHVPVDLTVFDALGRTVGHVSVPASSAQVTTQPLDLTSLGASLYVLQVRTAASLETRRVVRE